VRTCTRVGASMDPVALNLSLLVKLMEAEREHGAKRTEEFEITTCGLKAWNRKK